MSKAINGDPAIDDRVTQLTNVIKSVCTPSILRNLSKKVLRDLGRALGHAFIECWFWMPVRDDQRTAKYGGDRVKRGDEEVVK